MHIFPPFWPKFQEIGTNYIPNLIEKHSWSPGLTENQVIVGRDA